MSKTEQIITKWRTSEVDGLALIAELRRLAKLNEAYSREIDWYNKHVNPAWFCDRPEFVEIREATDAARREAGEGQ